MEFQDAAQIAVRQCMESMNLSLEKAPLNLQIMAREQVLKMNSQTVVVPVEVVRSIAATLKKSAEALGKHSLRMCNQLKS